MENLIEKLNKSELFPENIKKFIIQSIKEGKINESIILELEQMLGEEEKAIEAIDDK